MATTKKVLTKTPANKAVVVGVAAPKKFYYSLLHRAAYSGTVPLYDNEMWGPFDSPDECIKHFEDGTYIEDEEFVNLFIVEGVCIASLRSERKVTVEKTHL